MSALVLDARDSTKNKGECALCSHGVYNLLRKSTRKQMTAVYSKCTGSEQLLIGYCMSHMV